ncbi:MAG TPA: hypothetical protein VJK03_02630 [Candidatus Nanoarchaeia archaeon]|nr:hypothetical protein [Candidatus Nanoarchaeia archaeon]
MGILTSRRGLVGWLVVLAAFFVWIIVIVLWYRPNMLDLSDKTNLLIAGWWTIIAGVCIFIGIRMEKIRSTR